MLKFKDYSWALEGVTALILLIAFIYMAVAGSDLGTLIIIPFTGLGILFFTLMRIRPIIKSRDEKDYVLVMFSEIIIDVVIGIMMLFFRETVSESNIISFSRLSGIVLFIRGVSHFWTTSKRYELHDFISFVFHILFLSFGFYFLLTNELKEAKIVVAIMILSLLLVGYFSYRSYNGYNNFRIKKENQLKMNDYLDVKKENEIIDDPKTNDKKIEEPKEEKEIEEPIDDRPSIDVN